jgi:hypothetical protein
MNPISEKIAVFYLIPFRHRNVEVEQNINNSNLLLNKLTRTESISESIDLTTETIQPNSNSTHLKINILSAIQ